jgi:Ca-activated chloride channel family protein
MAQDDQQQQQGQQQQSQQGGQQQEEQQQQNPMQSLAQAMSHVRKVQNLLEMNYPNQGQAIQMQREAGDLIWQVIQQMQQQQQQQQQQ